MFIVYYSNQLEKQKEILSSLFKSLPPEDPFQQDIGAKPGDGAMAAN